MIVGASFTFGGGLAGKSHTDTGLDNACHCKADNDSNRRSHHIEAHGFHPDAPQFLQIPHRCHAHDERTKNDRNDHHFDKINEHGADRRDPCLNRADRAVPKDKPHNNGKHQ